MVSKQAAATRELMGWILDHIRQQTTQPCSSCGHYGGHVTTDEIAREFFDGHYNSARWFLRRLKKRGHIVSAIVPPRPKVGTAWALPKADDDAH